MVRCTQGRGWLGAIEIVGALMIALAGCGDDTVVNAQCAAGAKTCDGPTVLVCDPRTLLFVAQEECPVGTACLAGRCSPNGFQDTLAGDTYLPDTQVPDTWTPPDTTPLDTLTPDTLPPDTSPDDTVTPDTGPDDTLEPMDTAEPDDTREPEDTAPPMDTVEPMDTVAPDTFEPMDTVAPEDTVEPVDTYTPTDSTVVSDVTTDIVVVPDPFDPGPMNWDMIGNILVIGDLYRVKWHPSGAFAIILGPSGKVIRYDAETRTIALAGTLGTSLADLDVDPEGAYFAVVGADSQGQRLWRIHLDEVGAIAIDETLTLSYGDGVAVAVEPGRLPARFAVGTRTSGNVISRVYLYTVADGLSLPPGFAWNAGGGMTDLMWGAPSIYAGSPNIIVSEGYNGTDSHTLVIDSAQHVSNGWSSGYGNAGRAAWRTGPGDYGIILSPTSQIYEGRVFNGAWQSIDMPSPVWNAQAVAWRANGTRALVVGKGVGTQVKAAVGEIRAGTVTGWTPVFADQSIPDFDQAPWFGRVNQYLMDVDWRPGPCDEGLVVGQDNSSSSFNPTFGLIARFWDSNDPACVP